MTWQEWSSLLTFVSTQLMGSTSDLKSGLRSAHLDQEIQERSAIVCVTPPTSQLVRLIHEQDRDAATLSKFKEYVYK